MSTLRVHSKIPKRAAIFFQDENLTSKIDSKKIQTSASDIAIGTDVLVRWGKEDVVARLLFLHGKFALYYFERKFINEVTMHVVYRC